MTIRDEFTSDYFDWLKSLVTSMRSYDAISYDELLLYLHSVDFTYSMRMDANRASHGVQLRYRFALARDCSYIFDDYADEPCSVLEMMIALSLSCEENIMDNPLIGNRTGQWFWGMIVNLGLGAMTDIRFDEEYVSEVVERFLNREYEPNGKGGLFYVRNCDCDMRDVDIWTQACWYLGSIN